MDQTPPTQKPAESARNMPRGVAVLATLMALVVAVTWAALERGPWYDEFYTKYVTRLGPPWSQALRTSWLADHPPFFYMLMRATAWLGPIEVHRLVNLAVAAVTAAGGWLIVRREPRLHAPAAAMVLLLAANPWTLLSATELRSYFISLCAGALLSLALAISGLALADNARQAAARNNWLGTGRLIARTVAGCPGTAVHTDAYWNADLMAMTPPDNRHVAPWAYERVSRRLGFDIEPASSRRLSQTCPNLFWAEHDTTRRFDEADILQHIRESGFAIDAITLYRVGDGWVASDRPLPSATGQ
jgi:hypothetical protein